MVHGMTSTTLLLTVATRLLKENQHRKAAAAATQLVEKDARAAVGWAIRGLSYQALGQLDEARHDLQRALTLDPTSNRTRLALAQCLADLGQPERALRHLDPVLEAAPTASALALQAKWRRDIHWLAGALASEKAAVERYPTDSALRHRVAQNALREGDALLASTIFGRLPDEASANDALLAGEIAYALGKLDEARAHARAALEAKPTPEQALFAALQLFQTGPFDEAALAFRQLAEGPNSTVDACAWHARCQIFAASPDAAKSVADLQARHPNHPQTHCVLGIQQAVHGEADRAKTHLTEAISLEPTLAEAHLWLGELHRLSGATHDALAATDTGIYHTPAYCVAGELNRILTIHEEAHERLNPAVYSSHLSRCSGLLASDTLEHALATPNKRTVLPACARILGNLHGNRSPWPTRKIPNEPGAKRVFIPPDPRQEARACQLLLQTRPPAEVIDQFTTLTHQFSRHPAVLCHRGEVHLWLGNWEQARADFTEALRIERSTRWAWIGLGASQILAGEEEAGLATFTRSAQYACPGRTQWVYRAEARWRLGQTEAGLPLAQEALRINPERTSAHVLLGLLCLDCDQLDAAQREWRFVTQQQPAMSRQIALELDCDTTTAPPAHQLRTLFQVSLTAMRGNRASTVITWFFRDQLHLHINDPSDVTAQYGLTPPPLA